MRRLLAAVVLVAGLASCGTGAGVTGSQPSTAASAATGASTANAASAGGAASTANAAPAATTASTAGAASAGGAASTSRTTSPRRVLVLTQTRGYHHASIPAAARALRRIASADGRYQLVFLQTAAQLTPAALRHAATVVFLLTSGDLPLDGTGKQALVAFVQRGGGLVGFHSATDTFHHWPGYIALFGAEFSHHRHPSTERVVVEDRRTPATRLLAASFRIHEEFYVFKSDPRPHVRVLARLDTGNGGPDRPLVWCRRVGRGRVFYDALGHFTTTWSDRRQLDLVTGGIAWAAGFGSGGNC